MVSIFVAVALVLTSAILSVAFPLATYTFTLAAFGLTHVLTELHYVDNRFRQRLGNNLCWRMSQLLILIIGLRSLQVLSLIPTWLSITLELSCVVALVILVIPVLAEKDWRLGIFGTILCLLLSFGIFASATLTLLIFAILHNITPVGFIAERWRGKPRNYALLICVVVFILIPLLIISGLPNQVLSSFGLVAWEASLFPVGGLDNHLGVFVPPQLQNEAIAISLFSAAVFLQTMHYAVVIGVLPNWEKHHNSQIKHHVFPWMVGFLSVILFVSFTREFIHTRAVYGIIAAVHAWVEIPILLLALAIPENG